MLCCVGYCVNLSLLLSLTYSTTTSCKPGAIGWRIFCLRRPWPRLRWADNSQGCVGLPLRRPFASWALYCVIYLFQDAGAMAFNVPRLLLRGLGRRIIDFTA